MKYTKFNLKNHLLQFQPDSAKYLGKSEDVPCKNSILRPATRNFHRIL